jgi:hypothetical protein
MKNILGKTLLIGIVLLLVGVSALPSIAGTINEASDVTKIPQPQLLDTVWEENFDSYDLNSSLHGQGGWKGWDNDPAWTAYVSDDQARSSPHSVDIVGDADIVREFEGIVSGEWILTVWVYVPADLFGLSYFILLSDYADGAGQANEWAIQMVFDADQGLVISEHSGPSLPLVTDQWVEIRVEIDLDTDYFELYYDGTILEEKAWTAGPNNEGTGYLKLAAIDLFANSATSVYYDDLSLEGEATQPSLSCEGSLSWADVSPGDTVTGEFTIANVGAAGSELNWEIQNYPNWGTWTFTPENGVGLTPEDGELTISVEVVAPSDKNQNFTGSIRIVNVDNTNNFCDIDAALATPFSYNMPLLQRFINRHPIIAQILGL